MSREASNSYLEIVYKCLFIVQGFLLRRVRIGRRWQLIPSLVFNVHCVFVLLSSSLLRVSFLPVPTLFIRLYFRMRGCPALEIIFLRFYRPREASVLGRFSVAGVFVISSFSSLSTRNRGKMCIIKQQSSVVHTRTNQCLREDRAIKKV